MAQEEHMKVMFWIVFITPPYDDDAGGDPNHNDGRIMPDGSVPARVCSASRTTPSYLTRWWLRPKEMPT